jgi:putative copper export protein
MGADAVAVVERALALICIYQAAGAAAFAALFGRMAQVASERVWRLGAVAALLAIVLIVMRLPLTTARMAGDWSGMGDAGLLRLALHSSQATAAGFKLAGLALLAAGLWRRKPFAALLGAALTVGAPALTGHTSVNPQRALLAPLLIAHVAVGCFWLGALWPLQLTVRLETPAGAAAVLQRFSRIAGWLVPCLALSGVAMAALLINDWSVLQRPYGRLLLCKFGVFLILMGLAALNRWRYAPALVSKPQPSRRALQRCMRAEYLLIAAVLAMTATLTTLYSPED